MIHHLSLGTNDVERARAFYDPVLAVVGIRRMKTHETALDYGVGTLLIRPRGRT
jgi:catechol 2,3-dioxygenase-like lactoylglutathione lyase family enzyme